MNDGSNQLGGEPDFDGLCPTLQPAAETADNHSAALENIQAGLRHLNNGDYEQAIGRFDAVIRLEPTSRAYSLRAEAHQSLSDGDRALADFTTAIRLDPTNAAAYVGRGKCHAQRGEPAKAIADYTAALSHDPDNRAAYSGRASAYFDMADADHAVADYAAVLERNPRDLFALFNRGKAYAMREQHDLAVADFTRVLDINPNYIPGYLQRGHAQKAKGDYWQAVSDYTEILAHSQYAIAYTSRAHIYQIIGDYDRAVDDYTASLHLDPTDAKAYCGRGVAYRLKNDLHNALADLDEAVRLNPDDAHAYFHRGMIGLAVDQLPQAIAQFDIAISLDPDFTDAYLNRALAFERTGAIRDALQDCNRALELNPDLPVAYLIRGTAYLNAKRYDPAVADLSCALDLDPGFALAYRRRARAFTRRRAYAQALADYSTLLNLEPNDALAYANRGIVHRLMGNQEEAVADLDRAMRLDPKSILIGFDRGLGEIDQKQSLGAVMDYTEGRRAAPIEIRSQLRAAELPKSASIETVVTPLTTFSEQQVVDHFDSPDLRIVAKPEPSRISIESRDANDEVRETNTNRDTGADLFVAKDEPLDRDRAEDRNTPSTALVARSVRCPLCQTSGLPAEVIPGPRERVRCSKCKAVFVAMETMPAVATISAPTRARTSLQEVKKRHRSADEQEVCPSRWLQPLPMLGGSLAIAAVFFLLMQIGLFSPSRPVKVYPARGGVTLDGRPIPEALVTLHPADRGNPNFPLPRGTVKDDGSFLLGTFERSDGVPAGEYIVTVLWPETPVASGQGDNDDVIPVNKLPKKYGDPRTSEFKVQIRKGKNVLPAIDLKTDALATTSGSNLPHSGLPKSGLNAFPD